MWCRRQWENPDKNTPYAAYTATMYVDFILTFGLIARWSGTLGGGEMFPIDEMLHLSTTFLIFSFKTAKTC